MGRSLGRILAQKGANVVIVARTKSKLVEAVEYISVSVALRISGTNESNRFYSLPPRILKVNAFTTSAQI